jgi:hypothetical protein
MCGIRLLLFTSAYCNIVLFHLADEGIAGYTEDFSGDLLIIFTVLKSFPDHSDLIVFQILNILFQTV